MKISSRAAGTTRAWIGTDRVRAGVQTFLPYPDFRKSAHSLDRRRLGKQRVESLQVLRGLTRPGYGWRHHPAVKMWAGYEEALVRYGLEVCTAWCEAGLADTCAGSLTTELATACGIRHVRDQRELAAARELPPWLGRQDFHLSHRGVPAPQGPGLLPAALR